MLFKRRGEATETKAGSATCAAVCMVICRLLLNVTSGNIAVRTLKKREREREREREKKRRRVFLLLNVTSGNIAVRTLKEREREMDGWMDGLLYNQWIDHNNIVGER